MPRKKANEETVLLPIRVDLGGGNVFNAGQPVPVTKDFTKEDADKIIAFHGEYKGAVITVSDDANDALQTKIAELTSANKTLSEQMAIATKSLADVTQAWHAVEKSMTAEDGTDEANALEANVAALNALAASE
ncbi:MAG: hypothetical protein ABJO86_00680 [Lentilitoribacter sp.]